MADAFDSNAQDVGLSLDEIELEIRAGLALHADRLVQAFDCQEFYFCRNTPYIQQRESEDWSAYLKRPKRTSKMTNAVIKKLAKGLYSPGPTRRLKNSASADKFLTQVYEQNHVNALMKQCDRSATLNGYCAIQCYPTGRPEKPVIYYQWGAHETVVWTWPDDPTEAWAVVTITRERQAEGYVQMRRLRYDAWSRDEHRVYRTRWKAAPQAMFYVQQQYRGLLGEVAYFEPGLSGEPAGSGKNPYGVIPFSFVHTEPVVSDFYEGGLGPPLVDCNAEIDRELSDLAQHTREFMDPDRFVTGVTVKWRRDKRPGQWQRLDPGMDAVGDGGGAPKAEILQSELATETVWYNATTYLNQTLEELEVPLVAIHADVSTDLSGIAIVAKHVPLLERTKERQPLFAEAETDLASVTLHVSGAAYNIPEFQTIALAVDMELGWPIPSMPMPTPERDLADAFEMDQGISSLVGVVSKRGGMSLDQAKDAILEVIAQNAWLKSVMPKPDVLDALGNVVDPNAPADPDDDDDEEKKPAVEDDDQDDEK